MRTRILRYGPAEAAAAPAFLPTDLPGLWAWYDAGEPASVRTGAGGASPAATGDPVSEWRDLSGADRHLTQPTGASQPALQVSPDRRLQFDGSHMDYVPGVALAQPVTVFVVARVDGLASQQAIVDATGGALAVFYDATVTAFRLYAGGAGIVSPGPADTARHVLRAVFDGAFSVAALDDGPPVSGALGTNGLPGLRVGRNAGLSAPLGGHVSELIVVAGLLSPADTAAATAYLTGKWL